jgi:hypothetical protein
VESKQKGGALGSGRSFIPLFDEAGPPATSTSPGTLGTCCYKQESPRVELCLCRMYIRAVKEVTRSSALPNHLWYYSKIISRNKSRSVSRGGSPRVLVAKSGRDRTLCIIVRRALSK